MIERENSNDGLACPACGSIQPIDSRFCGACGAFLGAAETATTAIEVRSEAIDEEYEYDFETGITKQVSRSTGETGQARETPRPPIVRVTPQQAYKSGPTYTYGGATGTQRGSYQSSSYYPPARPYVPKDNAMIALIIGIMGFFTSCCLLPFVSLYFINKAEAHNEDSSIITIAKVIAWIQIGFMIIGVFLFIIFFIAIPFSFY